MDLWQQKILVVKICLSLTYKEKKKYFKQTVCPIFHKFIMTELVVRVFIIKKIFSNEVEYPPKVQDNNIRKVKLITEEGMLKDNAITLYASKNNMEESTICKRLEKYSDIAMATTPMIWGRPLTPKEQQLIDKNNSDKT